MLFDDLRRIQVQEFHLSVPTLVSEALSPASILRIVVQLLNDSGSILDDLLVGIGRILSERLDDSPDTHVLEGPSALLIDTKVADGEESDAPW